MEQTKGIIITTSEGPPPPENAILTGKLVWNYIPIPLTVLDINGKTIQTDYQGNFKTTLPLDTYTITFNHLLFNPYETSITLSETKTYEIIIQPTMKLWAKILIAAVPTTLIGSAIILRR